MSDKILMLMPSHKRPFAAGWCANTLFLQAARPHEIDLLVIIDHDDPDHQNYRDAVGASKLYITGQGGSFVKAINAAMPTVEKYSIVGIVNDDHRFVTPSWDLKVRAALTETGVAYPNDLYPFHRLPTSVFMTTDIPKALGYLAPPTLDHMYADNFWKAIGEGLNAYHYLEGVVVEHLHYTAGKSTMDETYAKSNTDSQKEKDRLAFEAWLSNDYKSAIERIRSGQEIPA